MNKNQIERILDGMSIQDRIGVQIPALKTIVLTTNQGIDANEDTLTFDLTKNILKIKSYKCSAISGKFAKSLTMLPNGIKDPFFIKDAFYPFRKPSLGDIVFFVRNGNILSRTTSISSVTPREILFSDNVSVSDSDIICYADPKKFNTGIPNVYDSSLLLERKPISKHSFDLFLSIDAIVGFELLTNKLSNS